jgi:predicted phage-related endonuclease
MTKEQLNAIASEIREYENLMEEAKNEIENRKDLLKAELMTNGTDELDTSKYVIRWTNVLSSRFDTATFKKEHGEMYKQYCRESASRRFTISD